MSDAPYLDRLHGANSDPLVCDQSQTYAGQSPQSAAHHPGQSVTVCELPICQSSISNYLHLSNNVWQVDPRHFSALQDLAHVPQLYKEAQCKGAGPEIVQTLPAASS